MHAYLLGVFRHVCHKRYVLQTHLPVIIRAMDRIETFKTIAAQAERGELIFPTNIDAALKIQQVLNDPDCNIQNVSKLVMTEPLLSARIVAIANSAAYNRTGSEIADVRNAINRLGFRTLQALAMAVVTRQFASLIDSPQISAMANQLWEHTAHVTSLCHLIAKRVTFLDPDAAMFTAIVHEVGGFYLLSRLNAYPGLLDGEPSEWVEHGEQEVGRAVLKRLAVPASVVEAVEAHWNGFLTLPPVTLGDTLLLANHLAPVPSPLNQLREEITDDVSPSLIDHIVGDETLSEILEKSAEEVASLTAALRF